MIEHYKDRIQNAIRHIQTAVDVDPWAMKIAVKAMEKQIPMKPKMPLDEYWVCPMCGRKVEYIYRYSHCMSCGQVIDWSEKNDE